MAGRVPLGARAQLGSLLLEEGIAFGSHRAEVGLAEAAVVFGDLALGPDVLLTSLGALGGRTVFIGEEEVKFDLGVVYWF